LFEKEMRGRSDLHLKEPLPILYPIIGYRYRSEAIITQDSAPALRDEIELLEPLELSGLPGSRVPHVWLEQRGNASQHWTCSMDASFCSAAWLDRTGARRRGKLPLH
jgi:hypothetical protein